MKDISKVQHNPIVESIVDVLSARTRANDRHFFRTMVIYNFVKAASMMRASIVTSERGKIPINIYAVALAPSGYGKGHSLGILEDEVMHLFRDQFMQFTFPMVAENNIAAIACKRANAKGSDPDMEKRIVMGEFESFGNYLYSFDSATTPAVKQHRNILLMSQIGALNFEMDEMGSNFINNSEVIDAFLELYDKGKIKQKLVKNTQENKRSREITGVTPANCLMFGTQNKLLNGSKEEDEFIAALDRGYARRSFFAFVDKADKSTNLTPKEIYDLMTDSTKSNTLQSTAMHLGNLSDITNYNLDITQDEAMSLLNIEYQSYCEKRASDLPEHKEIMKTEMNHRFFKAMKVAGALAFIEGSNSISEDNMYQAIKFTEESGAAFQRMTEREKNYVKLAKYITSAKKELTSVDMVEDLPFYKGTAGQKNELFPLAIAWAYKNGAIIKKRFENGIELYSGENLEPTDLNKLIVSHSNHPSENYVPDFAPFSQIATLTQATGLEWCNHFMMDKYRTEENSIPGFNMVVLDVDGTATIDSVKTLLKNYTYHIYCTKSHTESMHRFRVILPLSHKLNLDQKEFKEFMENIYAWLPFPVDDQTGQRCRKWSSYNIAHESNVGELVDVLPFIPRTSKNDEYRSVINSTLGLTNAQRWFLANTGDGNRSNNFIKYALWLLDSGYNPYQIEDELIEANTKLADKLSEDEIKNTIMRTVVKRHAAK